MKQYLAVSEKYRNYSCSELYEEYLPIRNKHTEKLQEEEKSELSKLKGGVGRIGANIFSHNDGEHEYHVKLNALRDLAIKKECYYSSTKYKIPEWNPNTKEVAF